MYIHIPTYMLTHNNTYSTFIWFNMSEKKNGWRRWRWWEAHSPSWASDSDLTLTNVVDFTPAPTEMFLFFRAMTVLSTCSRKKNKLLSPPSPSRSSSQSRFLKEPERRCLYLLLQPVQRSPFAVPVKLQAPHLWKYETKVYREHAA